MILSIKEINYLITVTKDLPNLNGRLILELNKPEIILPKFYTEMNGSDIPH